MLRNFSVMIIKRFDVLHEAVCLAFANFQHRTTDGQAKKLDPPPGILLSNKTATYMTLTVFGVT